MSNLRQAAQQALEALEWNLPVIEDYGDREQLNKQHRAITALRAALAEPEQDYERGFVDGMQEQMRRSVDKAVNRMAEPEPLGWITAGQHTAPLRTHWEGCEVVHPECKEGE